MLDVAGWRLRVAVRDGDPTRIPLLLINGIGASLESSDPFVDALDPAITVIQLNVPGIGGSPLPHRPHRLPALAPRIARMLDMLEHQRVDVLGISWGAGSPSSSRSRNAAGAAGSCWSPPRPARWSPPSREPSSG